MGYKVFRHLRQRVSTSFVMYAFICLISMQMLSLEHDHTDTNHEKKEVGHPLIHSPENQMNIQLSKGLILIICLLK